MSGCSLLICTAGTPAHLAGPDLNQTTPVHVQQEFGIRYSPDEEAAHPQISRDILHHHPCLVGIFECVVHAELHGDVVVDGGLQLRWQDVGEGLLLLSAYTFLLSRRPYGRRMVRDIQSSSHERKSAHRISCVGALSAILSALGLRTDRRYLSDQLMPFRGHGRSMTRSDTSLTSTSNSPRPT